MGELTARGFPAPFFAVFAGARFRVFAAFLPFFDVAFTAGFPLSWVLTGRVHYRGPRAFAYTGGIDEGYPK